MADKKISALTGATTPLAGTEVLPIVQSSSTVKVSVANLTAGRDVSMQGATLTGAYDQSAYVPSGWLGSWNNTGASGHQMYFGYNNGTNNRIGLYISGGPGTANQIDFTVNTKFYVYANGGVNVGSSGDPGAGNLTISNGNLIQGTAAKGVNFTANTPAAGMTSQLLNWYEEGTWTPTMTSASGTTTVNSSSGLYTRTGRCVFVEWFVDYTTDASVGTSTFTFGGLPFTCNASQIARGFVALSNWTGADYNDGVIYVNSSATTMTWESRAVNQSSRTNAQLYFSASYFV